MKVVIVEDEWEACEHITSLLDEIDSTIEVVEKIDTVKQAVTFFNEGNKIDLIFMDIHLADGISFDIFKNVKIDTPIIFTTAYDQYAIKAFKHNSIDYILKPLIKEELDAAIMKFKNQVSEKKENANSSITSLLQQLAQEKKIYKSTFLVHYKDALYPIASSDFAGFYIDLGIVRGITFNNKSFVINQTIEQLEEDVNPLDFYRVNRQIILHRNSIQKIDYYFNGKLKVQTQPQILEEIIVSKAKAKEFKNWLSK